MEVCIHAYIYLSIYLTWVKRDEGRRECAPSPDGGRRIACRWVVAGRARFKTKAQHSRTWHFSNPAWFEIIFSTYSHVFNSWRILIVMSQLLTIQVALAAHHKRIVRHGLPTPTHQTLVAAVPNTFCPPPNRMDKINYTGTSQNQLGSNQLLLAVSLRLIFRHRKGETRLRRS